VTTETGNGTSSRDDLVTAEGSQYLALAFEDAQDGRRVRLALAAAVAVHVVLFLAPLGFLAPDRALAEAAPTKVFVVEPVRFKPRPPEQQAQLPPERRVRVPIPDPTPDDPEPLRLDEPIEQELETPDIDLVAGIPSSPPPPLSSAPLRVGGDVTRPEKLSGPTPQYTEIARRARIQGVVIVEAIIDKKGQVTDVRVIRPLPMGLDQAAADAVRQWRFRPATLNGKPVDVFYSLTVNFQLQ
jgi:TonB family protein